LHPAKNGDSKEGLRQVVLVRDKGNKKGQKTSK